MISGYRPITARLLALSLTTQTTATRNGGPASIVAARSTASADLRCVARIAAPRSPKVFLHLEMAGVGRLPDLPEGPREADRERLTERNPDPDPLVEPDSLTATELDAADPGLMDTDSIGQSRLGEPQRFRPARTL
jgi:hypothetical protein